VGGVPTVVAWGTAGFAPAGAPTGAVARLGADHVFSSPETLRPPAVLRGGRGVVGSVICRLRVRNRGQTTISSPQKRDDRRQGRAAVVVG